MPCGVPQVVGQLREQLPAIAPMMPVQRHIDGGIAADFHQLAAGQLLASLQFRHQAPAQAGFGHAQEAFGRRAQVVQEAILDAQRCQVAVLQEVVRAVNDRRGTSQAAGSEALRKMPRHEPGAGQRPVAHGAQRQAARAGHRPLAATQAGRHFARTHAFQAHFLVFHHQVGQHVLLCAEVAHCAGPPGSQAVGVEGDAQALRHALLVQRRHLALQVAFEQAHLLHMVEQLAADFGRAWRCGTHQHRLADPRLEQLDALGDGRLRQAQHLRRAFETALLDHRGEGGQQLVVEHRFS
ncbi:hypothetical protein D3C79_654490 [compost metagenome]